MSSLLHNAVASIRIGVQDYLSPEADRHLSAVRNYYAGILLLAKEVLVRRFHSDDPAILLAAKLKPVVGQNGSVEIVPDGQTTIDFSTIGRRFRDLGIPFDPGLLNQLKGVRNDVEHRFSPLPRVAIVEAIAKGFPAAGQLFRLLDENPAELLGDAWTAMLETHDLFQAELDACAASLAAIAWRSDTMRAATPYCTECGSNLLEQADPSNDDQERVVLSCRACGKSLDTGQVIEATIEEHLSGEAYLRAKDAGEDGPYFDCPDCGFATYIDFEGACANCGYELQSNAQCVVCHCQIPLSEILAEPDRQLCSYHAHLFETDD